MSSPILFGGNNIAKNLQGTIQNPDGVLLRNDGPKNYIKYNNFENAATTGWSLGTTGTLTNGIPTGTPTFGSGAAGTAALIATNFAPTDVLSGNYSLNFADTSPLTVGNMVASDAFTVDLSDYGKVLTWSFNYKLTGVQGNFSGTSSNTFGVAVYDTYNNKWIPTTGNFAMTQKSGAGRATGTFQTPAGVDGLDLRFIIYVINTTSPAGTSISFDDFYLGPQSVALGSPVTDWQSFTPTGSWTSNTTYTGRWRRVGDTAEFIVVATCSGAPNATNLTVNIPFGWTIDSTKFTGAGSSPLLGTMRTQDVGVREYIPGEVRYLSSTSVDVRYISSFTDTLNLTNAAPFAYNTGDFVELTFRAPITGWSSQTQMSNDTDTRIIAFRGTNVASTPVSTLAKIPFTSAFDTAAGWSTDTYTVPVTGYYRVSANLISNLVTLAANQNFTIYVYKGAVCQAESGNNGNAASSFRFASISTVVQCNAGDTLSIQAISDVSTTLFNASGACTISIERLSGPAVVAATESVNGYYYTTGTTINNTSPTITFGTKVYDSHAAMSGSTLTIPVSGVYSFSMFLTTASASWTAGYALQGLLTVGGVQYVVASTRTPTMTSILESNGNLDMRLNAGDQITFQVYSDTATTLSVTAYRSRVQWKRIGN